MAHAMTPPHDLREQIMDLTDLRQMARAPQHYSNVALAGALHTVLDRLEVAERDAGILVQQRDFARMVAEKKHELIEQLYACVHEMQADLATEQRTSQRLRRLVDETPIRDTIIHIDATHSYCRLCGWRVDAPETHVCPPLTWAQWLRSDEAVPRLTKEGETDDTR